jgi:O-antigen/teichoic acid export membrane protein
MPSTNPAYSAQVSPPLAADLSARSDRTAALGKDLARFGTAITIAIGLGAIQVLVVPRELDVTAYGEYRVFLVYASYLGALHLGLADGAFVRWVGRTPAAIRAEAPRVARWLLGAQASLLAAALATTAWVPSALVRTYVAAFAACALCVNAATLASYALQAAGDFSGAGRVAVLPSALFVVAVLIVPTHSLSVILAAYVAANGVAAMIGAARVARMSPREHAWTPTDSPPLSARRLLRVGLPVLGANLAAGLSSSIDRILVSLSVPIRSFALYGFATTVMVVASATTQVLSRVSLSHAARRSAADRATFLEGFYDVILAGFGIGLAVIPLFERIVLRSLPAYSAALPIVRAAAVASVFWVAVHVVLVGTLQSYGLVRRQFALELGGAALVAAMCGVALAMHLALWSVAAAAAMAAVATWGVGVIVVLRSVPGSRAGAGLRFMAIAAVQCGALAIAFMTTDQWTWRSLGYAALAGVPTALAARTARAHWRGDR